LSQLKKLGLLLESIQAAQRQHNYYGLSFAQLMVVASFSACDLFKSMANWKITVTCSLQN